MTAPIRTLAIIGTGTMGTGIAADALRHGFPVTLFDADPAAVERARQRIAAVHVRFVERGRMAAEDAAAAAGRLIAADGLAAVGGADLVVEAVFEEVGVKRSLYAALAPHLGSGTLVASNTSAIRIDDLAASLPDPSRFLGLHYFSPAEISPLVEVIRGSATAEATVERALGFLADTARRPLICRDSYGFAINRFFCPYTNEAARLLDEGVASPAAVDAVAVNALGIAAGPFQVMNLVKPRIALHAIRNLAPLGPFYAPARSMTEVGDAEGTWDLSGPAEFDAPTADLVAGRLRGSIFLPVLELLDADVAAPADIDAGARLALKFGEEPCATMDALGRDAVAALVEPLCAAHGTPVPASLARVGTLRAG